MICNGSLLKMVVLALFPMMVALSQEDTETMTNADIVTLTEAGLSPSAIIALNRY